VPPVLCSPSMPVRVIRGLGFGMGSDTILLAHGGGGSLMRELIEREILPGFSNEALDRLDDSAIIEAAGGRLAMTTDSYVVHPLVFPGGDIGKLAVCGTVNDLAVAGARPLYLTLSLVIEEGLPIDALRQVLRSAAETARDAGVQIVTGDTKVVERGKADKLFINTAGVGVPVEGASVSASNVRPGACVIINGPIGDHGIAVVSRREGIEFKTPVESDVAPLWGLVERVLDACPAVQAMKDATRGGLAAVLNEVAAASDTGLAIRESDVPVRDAVRGACELFGYDPLYVANEGKVVVFCPAGDSEAVLAAMRAHPLGRDAAVIGEATDGRPGRVLMDTSIGGRRIVDMPYGEQLPRIC